MTHSKNMPICPPLELDWQSPEEFAAEVVKVHNEGLDSGRLHSLEKGRALSAVVSEDGSSVTVTYEDPLPRNAEEMVARQFVRAPGGAVVARQFEVAQVWLVRAGTEIQTTTRFDSVEDAARFMATISRLPECTAAYIR